jgi:hypothetical protein
VSRRRGFVADDLCPSAPPPIVEARAVSGSGKGSYALSAIDFCGFAWYNIVCTYLY